MAASCVKTPPVVKVVEAQTPRVSAELKRKCSSPYKVPKGSLKRSQVVRGWNRDRTNLRICAARHSELARQVTTIEKGG